ncbi:MAG: PAS-domain containing protein [Alphaproteobacteria bacterium]
MVGWETVPMTSTKPVGNGQTPRLDVATDGGRSTSAALRLLKTISGEQIFDFLEDLPIGVLLFDQDDRLVRYNRKALEVAEQNAAAYVPGTTFEDIVRSAVRTGMLRVSPDQEDDYVAARLARHRNPGPPFEFKAGELWVQVAEHVIEGVGTVIFHTDITDQKRVQAALRQSEQRFRDYAESASDWLWEIDGDFRCTYHAALDQVDGPHIDTFISPIGKTRWEIAGIENPESDPLWAEHIATLKAKRPFRDFRYTMGGGEVPIQHYRLNGRPVFDENGAFVGYRGSTTIETESVEREKLLHLRQSQLSEAIEQVLVGVALYDENDRLITRNNLARDFGPLSDSVKPGARFEDLVRECVAVGLFPDAVGREEAFIRERLERHRNPGEPFEYRRAGRWMVVRETRFQSGHTMAVFTDITDIKRAEEALRESEAKFRALVEGSLQGVCIQRDLKPVFANQAFADIYGFKDPDAVLAIDSLLLLFPQDQWQEIAQSARAHVEESRPPITKVQPAVRRDGEIFYIESRIGVIEWDGEPALQVSVIDVTERETMTRLKDEFVSTVSHELRTPLTSISGALGLIASGMAGHVPPKIRELIEIANNNAERLVRLIGDILDIQKIESGRVGGRRVEVDIQTLLTTAATANQGLAEKNGVVIDVVADARPVSINGDTDQLMQVMTNLLSNAIKFSPRNGKIEMAFRRDGETVVISVSDNGPGVPPEFRDKIFEKFVQVEASDSRPRGGTGLGLSICRSLVEHHGGSMGYEDRPQGGARFCVRLPIVDSGATG